MFIETTEIQDLAILASCYRAEFEMRADELLTRLESVDPELATRVIEAIGDRHGAALWLVWSNKHVGGVCPLIAVASGKRESVLKLSVG